MTTKPWTHYRSRYLFKQSQGQVQQIVCFHEITKEFVNGRILDIALGCLERQYSEHEGQHGIRSNIQGLEANYAGDNAAQCGHAYHLGSHYGIPSRYFYGSKFHLSFLTPD